MGVLAVLGWVLAVVLAGSIAWRAVTVIDTDTTRSGVLGQAQVLDALAQARAIAAPTPTPSSTPTPTSTPTTGPTPSPTPTTPPTTDPTTPPPAPPATTVPEVVRSWTVTGGVVEVACRATVISLLRATPADGWRVEVKDAGPVQVVVELEGEQQEVTLRATCVGGVPEQQVGDGSGSAGDDSHDSDVDRED